MMSTLITLALRANGLVWALLCLHAVTAWAQTPSLVMASTTSTEQSGLFAHLLPAFKRDRGIDIKVVALGTGQALDMGRRGDVDILFVHDQVAEEKMVADGFALRRHAVMYNDFVLVGPLDDPARVRGPNVVAALQKIAAANAPFISRADKSGTHAAEMRFWQLAERAQAPGQGYRACGCGMGQALNMAATSSAYTLTDRATWLAFKNRANLTVLVEGDRRLFNQYGVLVVNPQRHPHVKADLAQVFVDWVVSPFGQSAIGAYQIGGQALFFPNAEK